MTFDPFVAGETLKKSEPTPSNSREWDYGDPLEAEGVDMSDGEDEGPETEDTDSDSEPEEADDLEEVSEPETEEEISARPEEEDEEEEEVKPTPRAQKRIQELVKKNKATEQRLEDALSALAQATQQQTALFQRSFDQADQQRQAQQNELARQQRMQALIDNNYDPANPAHAFLIQYDDDVRNLRGTVETLHQELQRERAERAWADYYSRMDGSFTEALKGFNTEDLDMQELRRQAASIAVTQQLADPSLAVQQVLKPFLRFLPKKKATAKVVKKMMGDEEKNTHRAIAMKAPSGTKKKGTKVTGRNRNGRATIQDVEDELWGTRTDWD